MKELLKLHPSLQELLLDIPKVFQREESWGKLLGSGLYKSEIIMEKITSYTPNRKDTIITTRLIIECKVSRTERQTTVTLQTIA